MSNQQKTQNTERIKSVIQVCKSVEENGVDPFAVNVDDIIDTLQKFFPEWESTEELTIDAEAVQCLASVIQNQGKWVKHRSTSLYTDPFLLQEKILTLTKQELAKTFASVWNPIIEMEQITIQSLNEAIKYWNELEPIDERWQQNGPLQVEAEGTTREELLRQKILAEKTFKEELQIFYEDLIQKVGKKEKILYWDFIGANTYPETLQRAYLTSFLVTYGYATLELVPLEELTFVKPLDEPRSDLTEHQMVSVPISVDYKEWKQWKEQQ